MPGSPAMNTAAEPPRLDAARAASSVARGPTRPTKPGPDVTTNRDGSGVPVRALLLPTDAHGGQWRRQALQRQRPDRFEAVRAAAAGQHPHQVGGEDLARRGGVAQPRAASTTGSP